MNLYRALIAALVIGSGSLLAACGERPDVSTPAAAPGDRPSARAPITAHIVVQRGQSLRRITPEYHVEERDIIAANHLAPPYTLKPGTFLTITVAAPEPKNQNKPASKPPAQRAHQEKRIMNRLPPNRRDAPPSSAPCLMMRSPSRSRPADDDHARCRGPTGFAPAGRR